MFASLIDLHNLQNKIITNYFVLTTLTCLHSVLSSLDDRIGNSKGSNPRIKVAKRANSGAGTELRKCSQGDDDIFHVSLTGTW
jgi:hypothetical protein